MAETSTPATKSPPAAPARTAPVFLRAAWHELVMANYRVPGEWLESHCPKGVELDTFDGAYWVSLVAFLFRDTRVLGLPIPFHRHFVEVNLRFYVRDGGRRGTVFISEIVPKPAITWVARTLYNENYRTLPTRAVPGIAPAYRAELAYNWGVEDEHGIRVKRHGKPTLPATGSLAEFITEHYWGYSAQRNGATKVYQVEHPQWRVWNAASYDITCDFAELYGTPFEGLDSRQPEAVFVAEGSPILVRWGRRLTDA